MTSRFASVTPLVPAGPSLAEALDFYVGRMGFQALWQEGDMAGIERDGIGFHLVRNNEPLWARNASFSIGVAGLDALYAEYRDLPAQIGPLEMKSWGRREFHLIVPPGVCFQFYEFA